jgi:TRAP-type C4-dicarboxylate transport system substrate-binding protein
MKTSKTLITCLAFMFALGLILCMSSAYAAQTKPIILKYAVWTPSPDVNVFSKANSWLIREVEKRSKGRLKVEYYWSGSLVPGRKTVKGVRSGVADIANIMPDYQPGLLPLTMVGSLPAISHDFWTSAMAFRELAKMPEIKAEFDKHNMMYLGNVTNISFGYWTKVPVRKIADLKGLKIVGVGQRAKLVKALGSVAVSMISTEVYPAMEKGTADGAIANPGYASDYNWQEICPWYYNLSLGNNGNMFLGMNKDSWNKLPADIQQLFLGLQEEAIKQGHIIYQGNAEDKLKHFVAEGIVTCSNPNAADRALLNKTAKEVIWMKWVEAMEKQGLPGQKVLDNWIRLNKKYAAIYPFER